MQHVSENTGANATRRPDASAKSKRDAKKNDTTASSGNASATITPNGNGIAKIMPGGSANVKTMRHGSAIVIAKSAPGVNGTIVRSVNTTCERDVSGSPALETALSVVTIYVQIVATVTIDPDAHGTDPNSAGEANHLEVVGSVLHLSRGQVGLVRSVGALHLGAAMGDAAAMGAATMA